MVYSPINIAEKKLWKVIKTDPATVLPRRMSPSATGHDLYNLENINILRYGRKLISTSTSIEMPKGVYGWIVPRSSLVFKKGLNIRVGVIDPNYTGER